MKGYRVSCGFGFRFHPVFFFPEWHRGIDMACPEGNPVYATYSGTVYKVGNKKRNGNYVKINHNNGYSSAYVHLQSYCVKEGQKVTVGQCIGKSGNTGTSTGPHLHFAIYKSGRSVNPRFIINL
jgi:murein DD-endopeptidase MepM/ murein hydrolase activator NlpD